MTVAVPSASSASPYGMIAPLSGQSAGLSRAQVSHGIREVVLCKGADNKIGLRCQVILNTILYNRYHDFICFRLFPKASLSILFNLDPLPLWSDFVLVIKFYRSMAQVWLVGAWIKSMMHSRRPMLTTSE